jgi:hypothetical protein
LFAAGCAMSDPAEGSGTAHAQQSGEPATSSVEQGVTICDLLVLLGGNPASCPPSPSGTISVVSTAPSSLTYATSGWSTCTMTYTVLATGFTDSFPWPTESSGTAGAGAGVRYTLSCSFGPGGLTLFSSSATTLVF